MAGLGVLGLGLSAEPDHLDHPTAPAGQIVLAFLGLVVLLGAGEVWGGESKSMCMHAVCVGGRNIVF